MSWNVQNLFVPGSGDGPRTESKLEDKVAALAAIINGFQPDVLALHEVGSDAALVSLQSALRPVLPHRLLGLPDARGIRVALLSRRVLRDRVDVARFPAQILPTCTASQDPAGNRDIEIVVCHLKSKLLTCPGGRFLRETKATGPASPAMH